MRINREDMLELTRRMTVKRSSITRIAGAYMDRDGYVDGTFNTNFLKLSPADKEKNLALGESRSVFGNQRQSEALSVPERTDGSRNYVAAAQRDQKERIEK